MKERKAYKMQKEILIVTLLSNFNYGNRLQAIAMNEIVSNMGYKPVFLRYKLSKDRLSIKKLTKRLLGLLGVQKYKESSFYCKSIRERIIRKDVNCQLTYTNEQILDFLNLEKIDTRKYSAVIAGSDQIWHRWTNHENELNYFYLSFAPQNKRIAFAASFGFDYFPKEDVLRHKEGLNGIEFISCREQIGCQLIKKLTGRETKCVLDPTLCLAQDYWQELVKKPRVDIPREYALLFFLGKKEKWEKEILDFSKNNGLHIIDMQSLQSTQMWKMTPGNFLWLIKNASVVLTDSFHCVAFSIIFHVQFIVFHRIGLGFENMFDRISTLLEVTRLEKSEYKSGKLVFPNNNYYEADRVLAQYRAQSIEWLQNSICKVISDANESH